MTNRLAMALVAAAMTGAVSLPSSAQSTANVQVALDKPVELEVADAPINAVFEKLHDATGVKFVISPEVYECLPYGDQTRLAVKLKNVTLRKALSPMLSQQAMDWVIDRDAVRIEPTPALIRMNRRANYDELRILGKMHSAKLDTVDKAGTVIDQLRKITEDKDLNLLLQVKADKDAAAARADKILPATAANWLDMLCHGQGWTWYLSGSDIIVTEKAAQVTRQLQRQVSVKYENAKLVDVLLDLARRAHVPVTMDPGVIKLLPAQVQENFNLAMTEATVAQALEVISGATGLKFTPKADGVNIEPSQRIAEGDTGGSAARPRSPFMLKKILQMPDGTTMELLIRPENLPPDLQKAIEAEREKLVKQLMEKYGVTTQPATKPAEEGFDH